MSTHTINLAATSTTSASPPAATLGARLAAVSRRAQGFTTVINDPAVLAELRGLCASPRPASPSVIEKHEAPAP